MATGNGDNSSVYSLLDDKSILSVPDEGKSISSIESEFEKIVGLIEDIFVGEDFQARHSDYFTQHCTQFSKGTDPPVGSAELEALTKQRFDIFRTYSVETAAFLERELQRSLGDKFEIGQFIEEVEKRQRTAESELAKERARLVASSGVGEQESTEVNPSLPRLPDGAEESAHFTELTDAMGGEIFEMLLTLKDFGRFQELMGDFLEMVQGNIPDMDGLVSLRHISDDEDEEGGSS